MYMYQGTLYTCHVHIQYTCTCMCVREYTNGVSYILKCVCTVCDTLKTNVLVDVLLSETSLLIRMYNAH